MRLHHCIGTVRTVENNLCRRQLPGRRENQFLLRQNWKNPTSVSPIGFSFRVAGRQLTCLRPATWGASGPSGPLRGQTASSLHGCWPINTWNVLPLALRSLSQNNSLASINCLSLLSLAVVDITASVSKCYQITYTPPLIIVFVL